MRIKLINDFHDTETFVRAEKNRVGYTVSRRAHRAANNRLCGCDCQCGGIRGGDYQLEDCGEYAIVYCQGERL